MLIRMKSDFCITVEGTRSLHIIETFSFDSFPNIFFIKNIFSQLFIFICSDILAFHFVKVTLTGRSIEISLE